MRGKDSHARV
jgi:alpha-mannosidase